ncbi:MAG: hypothetical protein FJZ00_13730 [Candidatus Sericytochromatia bacterium]|uniref:Uncharacterized protein n=1 Tax=Candidatus Tanganyikabacteria bacterium TaxID=2961651 RepID=A0A937X8Q5_9BACT|nr:hypothetical protein [Candidatus Tanganyikabacteria bacterium]
MEIEEKATKKRAPSRKRPASHRRKRKTAPAVPYNPGQVRMLEALVEEFAGKREIAQGPGGTELTVRLPSDIPHLEVFIEYKLHDLRTKQARLASLWDLTGAS